jgi:hypothetical protein
MLTLICGDLSPHSVTFQLISANYLRFLAISRQPSARKGKRHSCKRQKYGSLGWAGLNVSYRTLFHRVILEELRIKKLARQAPKRLDG